MSDQALTSLAILTVNWNRGHDVIESFVPLVCECLRRDGRSPVSAHDLQQSVKKHFRLTIPVGALQVMLGRCQRQGFVRRANNVYEPVRKRLNDIEFGPNQAEALRQHGCLLDKLRAFARGRYEIEWSEADADAALLGYLQENSLPVLAAATEGDPLPQPTRQSLRTKHVVSAFAGHLSEADPEGFTCMETVVKGHVLSTVLFYPDIGQAETRFQDLDVYCDTPFILPAIGYAEEGIHTQYVELIDLLRDLGANLKCFHHTEEEVAGVLEAEAANLRGSTAEPTDYYTSRPFSLTEIEELIVKLPATIRALGIDIVDTPPWTDSPNEVALAEAIENEIHYFRERAREKDVLSLAAIHRLRGGRRMDRLESAKALFLTPNTRLSRASSHFFRDVEGRGGIPICINTTLLTRLAWVKKPLAAPDLPRYMVIASSYAALNPSNVLWRQYLEEVERRKVQGGISEEEYVFMRSSREAREALMDETLGDDEAFSAGTYDEVLAHAKAQFQAEADARADAAREAERAAQAEAESHRVLAEGIERVHRDKVDRQSRLVGEIVGWGLGVTVALAAAVGIAATIPGVPLLEIKSDGWRDVVWICLAVFLALTAFAVIVKHVPVLGLKRAVAKQVADRWRERGHRQLDELHAKATEPPP